MKKIKEPKQKYVVVSKFENGRSYNEYFCSTREEARAFVDKQKFMETLTIKKTEAYKKYLGDA